MTLWLFDKWMTERGWVRDAAVICGFCPSGIRLHKWTCACWQRHTTQDLYIVSVNTLAALSIYGKTFVCFLQRDRVLSCMWRTVLFSLFSLFTIVRAYSICIHMCLCVYGSDCVYMSVSLTFFSLCCTVCIMVSWGFRATPTPVSSVVDHWST